MLIYTGIYRVYNVILYDFFSFKLIVNVTHIHHHYRFSHAFFICFSRNKYTFLLHFLPYLYYSFMLRRRGRSFIKSIFRRHPFSIKYFQVLYSLDILYRLITSWSVERQKSWRSTHSEELLFVVTSLNPHLPLGNGDK